MPSTRYMDNTMSEDDIERRATELGLSKLAAQQADELKKALENAENLAKRLPKDLHWTEEPAHTFSAKELREPQS